LYKKRKVLSLEFKDFANEIAESYIDQKQYAKAEKIKKYILEI